MLIGQINPNATDPSTWSAAIDKNGFGIVVAAVILAGAVLLVGYVVYRVFSPSGIVEKLFTRLDTFLTSLQGALTTTHDALTKQAERCETMEKLHTSGTCNPSDLRAAGHSFAEMGVAIGRQVGVDVSSHAAEIHKTLRGTA